MLDDDQVGEDVSDSVQCRLLWLAVICGVQPVLACCCIGRVSSKVSSTVSNPKTAATEARWVGLPNTKAATVGLWLPLLLHISFL
jgi:hypothetical protein